MEAKRNHGRAGVGWFAILERNYAKWLKELERELNKKLMNEHKYRWLECVVIYSFTSNENSTLEEI